MEVEQTKPPDHLSICSHCQEQINSGASFCWSCGKQVKGVREGALANPRTTGVVVVVILGITLILLYVLLYRNGDTSRSSSVTSAERNMSSVIASVTQPSNKLTNARVEDAVGRLTANLRVGGRIAVEGIQELPQENAARADLRFISFQYKSDMAGTPLSNDKQTPKKPEINSPNFYDELFKYGTQQVQTRSYTGQGWATLKKYNDGRWVVKEVHWEFHGWVGSADVK